MDDIIAVDMISQCLEECTVENVGHMDYFLNSKCSVSLVRMMMACLLIARFILKMLTFLDTLILLEISFMLHQSELSLYWTPLTFKLF